MNIFSAARRLGIVVSAIGVLIAGVLFFSYEPSVWLKFSGPGRIDPNCTTEYMDSIRVTVRNGYFLAYPCRDKFPPVRAVPPQSTGAPPVDYSTMSTAELIASLPVRPPQPGQKYAPHWFKESAITPEDRAYAESLISAEKRRWFFEVVRAAGIGLAAFWLAAWAIGWVVRGALGIPMGRDSKA
ncbi:hypothetical protein PSQ40_04980 [Curvibacter sp. HBC61]|uniref:DUF3592 domain-containing protein n=2 Tax=Curvibacter cyanobacteriorum TaxID=3026422 RepID=A0ABT5MVI7_9BURK|nr:hypothetical protein [Curvibacter sp. HBC61]